MTDIADLLERNADFAAGEFAAGPAPTMAPRGRLMVVGCVDPRVDPERVLGLERGEAVVIRNAGGRLTPAALRDMAVLDRVGARANMASGPGGPFNLVILHHTHCGLSLLDPHDDAVAAYFETPLDGVDASALGDPFTSVRADVEIARQSIRRPGHLVSGLVYDVVTGRVEVVVPAAAVPVG
ncbi:MULTISPECIES: carbonic anhydrase [Pseudonocardia]|uniref:carbonic anhydrase n=1 Tax=Pseudonocardia TaxID=1847 RepID=UPI000CD2C56C|nr:carbonic anhydrase [Pseudonocardia dioxanivorans]GJF05046.1 carbonic anhydrase [Pseudonocardia sp. D17]